MKLRSLIAVPALALLVTPASLRSEVIELTTIGGKTYHQCRILKVEVDGVMFRHANGGGKVLFKDMTKDWREHFNYDPAKVRAHEEKAAEDRKKARAVALERAHEAAKARQAELDRQADAQAMMMLRSALQQNNAAFLANGWQTVYTGYAGSQWNGFGPWAPNNKGTCKNGVNWSQGCGHLPYAGTRYFNTACNTNCATSYFNNTLCKGFTPRPFFAVPGVGINAAAPKVCAPVITGTRVFCVPH